MLNTVHRWVVYKVISVWSSGKYYRKSRYSLGPVILVGERDESRRILVIGTFNFIHFFDKYFGTEGVVR